ncbi:hypothetical protein [Bdellovibrio sp. HCB209]|uniref:hypothetical protein n=1 Tax=Bdellovibrio sp. HCB209 TaxID=3394354 RepID=UPI0039B526D3
MLQKHLMITAALLATLGLTACNKDKTVGGPGPQQQEQTPVTGGDLESDLPQLGGTGTSGQTSTDQSVVDLKPSQPGTEISGNYKPSDRNNVESDAYGKRLTGGVSKDGLLYTSTSTDDTIDVIRGLKRDSLGLAASVTWANLKFDSITDESIVTLKVNENGFAKTYNLAGYGSQVESNQIVKLKATRSGNGSKTTGSMPINGTLQCLDLDGGCDTTLVKVQLGYAGSASLINVIFRQSIADLYFNMPKKHTNNPEYAYIKEMVANSTSRTSEAQNRVKTSRMHSWEVANGRAGFTVAFRTYTDELIGFSGPLLTPEAGNMTDITLTRLQKDLLADGDSVISDSVSLSYQNSIGEARLIANNGLGQLRLALKMRKRSTYKQDVFTVTFMRRIKPVIDLSQSPEEQEDHGQSPFPGDGGSDEGDLPSVE